MRINEDYFDKISAICIMACYDQDAIITFKGIEDRLGIDLNRVHLLVDSRPELFSKVVAEDWMKEWKSWVLSNKPRHYPGWVLKKTPSPDEREKTIEGLQHDKDVFRSQIRTRGGDWIDTAKPPGAGPADAKQVALGLEHLDRLRKARAEARAQMWTRWSIVGAIALPLAALVLTNYLTYTNNALTSKNAAHEATIKDWDLRERIAKDAYESLFEAMQAAYDTARRGDQGKEELQNQLARIRMNLLRVERLIGDFRNDIWQDYERCLDEQVNGGATLRVSPYHIF